MSEIKTPDDLIEYCRDELRRMFPPHSLAKEKTYFRRICHAAAFDTYYCVIEKIKELKANLEKTDER